MGAGQLTEKYSFQKRVKENDGAGNTVSNWEEHFQCSGGRTFFKGREKVIAAAETSTQELIITVRNSSITRLVTSAWRAVDLRSGETYNIRGSEPSKDRKYIDFLAQSGGSDG